MSFFNSKKKNPLSSQQPSKSNLSYNFKSPETKQLLATSSSSKTKEIFSNYLGKFTQKVTEGVSAVSSIGNKTQEVSDALNNWKYFMAFFIAGIALIALSFPYLTVLLLFPHKFAGLFSLGSISILASLAILKGPWTYFKSFLAKEKLLFSLIYLGSLFGTFYVAVIEKSFFLTIIFSFIQVFF